MPIVVNEMLNSNIIVELFLSITEIKYVAQIPLRTNGIRNSAFSCQPCLVMSVSCYLTTCGKSYQNNIFSQLVE
jgi:hypothetical protein